ncbi:hypothetical protein WA158_002927 [Blastocystis sp. Blastoise]
MKFASIAILIICATVAYANCLEHGWPDTGIGDTATIPCNKTGQGVVTRLCTIHGWQDPDYSQCTSHIPCNENSAPRLLTLYPSNLYCYSRVLALGMVCKNGTWNILRDTRTCVTSSNEESYFVLNLPGSLCPVNKTAISIMNYHDESVQTYSDDILCIENDSAMVYPIKNDLNLCKDQNNTSPYSYVSSVSGTHIYKEEFIPATKHMCLPPCSHDNLNEIIDYDTGIVTNQEGQNHVTVECNGERYVTKKLEENSVNVIAIKKYSFTPENITLSVIKKGTNGTIACGARHYGQWPQNPTCTDVFSNLTIHTIKHDAPIGENSITVPVTKGIEYVNYCCGTFDGNGVKTRIQDTEIFFVPDIPSCPATTINNVTLPHTYAGRTIQTACPAGQTGSVTATCDENGAWSVVDVSNCKVTDMCLAVFEYGISFPTLLAGNSFNKTCNMGFAGYIIRYCHAGSTWGPVENRCYAVPYCAADIYHEVPWTASKAGETHSHVCPAGEKGSITRLCNDKGHWEVVDEQCTHVADWCPEQTLGNYSLPLTEPDKNATVHCSPYIQGYATTLCVDGHFNPIYEHCYSVAGSCATEVLDSIDWPETLVNTTATLSCPSNQKGSITRYCNNGKWEAPSNTCKPLQYCTDEIRWNIHWPQTEMDSTASVLCMNGYPSKTSRQCNGEGHWENITEFNCFDNIPYCPDQITSEGHWPMTGGNLTAEIDCPAGRTGKQTRSCSIAGYWGDIESNCAAIVCPAESVQGYIWSETPAGSRVTLECMGDQVTGFLYRECDSKGKWEPVSDKCLYPCPKVSDGQMVWPLTKAHNSVSLECPDGYSGYITRTCLDNSQWGPKDENCVLLTCPAEGRFPATEGNKLVEVYCNPSFTFLGGVSRECHDGIWGPETGSCNVNTAIFYGSITVVVVLVILVIIYAVYIYIKTKPTRVNNIFKDVPFDSAAQDMATQELL